MTRIPSVTAALAALVLVTACEDRPPPGPVPGNEGSPGPVRDDPRPDAPETGPAQRVEANLQLVPRRPDTPMAYCRVQPDGRLQVTVMNAGNGASTGGESLIVTFLTPAPRASAATLPVLAAGAQRRFAFVDREGCLSTAGRNCDFTIQLAQQAPVSGFCLQ